MPKSNQTQSPKPTLLDRVSPADADRLDSQYSRLLRVAGVVHTIRNAVESKDNEGQDHDLVAMFDSLCVVEEMLIDIAGQSEPPALLAREAATSNAKVEGQAIPPNPMCLAGDALGTMESAHSMMELINALDCNEGTSEFEIPVSGASSVARLREMVEDSIRYAAEAGGRKP
jgi:hypothetical protein